MVTVKAPKKGLRKKVFRSHQSKKGSKVSGTGKAETKLAASRTIKKYKNLGKVFRKKFYRKSKNKGGVDSDTIQTESINELSSVVQHYEDDAVRKLNYESDYTNSHTVLTFIPSLVQVFYLENQVLENSISGENSLPLPAVETELTLKVSDRTNQAQLQETAKAPSLVEEVDDSKHTSLIPTTSLIQISYVENQALENSISGINSLPLPAVETELTFKASRDNIQVPLHEIVEPPPLLVEASEESRLPILNCNSNLDESSDTKQGWLQNYFVCRSGGSFILHSL